MTPTTTAQNLLIWAAAFALAVLLSFLGGIATHWPEGGSIDWRGVALDVIQTIVATAPLVAAGFGLPRLGKEAIASLVSDVGKGPAQAALEVEAMKQSGEVPVTLTDADVDRLARRGLELMRETPAEIKVYGSGVDLIPRTTPAWMPPADSGSVRVRDQAPPPMPPRYPDPGRG